MSCVNTPGGGADCEPGGSICVGMAGGIGAAEGGGGGGGAPTTLATCPSWSRGRPACCRRPNKAVRVAAGRPGLTAGAASASEICCHRRATSS